MKRLYRLASVMWVLLVVGCTLGAEAETSTPLVNAFGSAEEVMQATLDALLVEDEARLADLLITRDEWEDLLWPEMPDKDHTPFEFVWGMSSGNSAKSLQEALQQYGGLPFEVVQVEYTKDAEVYPSFTLHKGAQVLVRRPDTGEEGIMPIFDVFVEFKGAWKLMNYDEF